MKNVKSALRLIALITLIAFSSSAARAQDVRLKLIHDDATRAVVAERLGSASARGVPTEPLMSKALEGVAKRATPKDIKNAMNALEKRLRLASELLSPTVSVDEMAAGADALAAGVSEKSLKALRTAAPTRSVAMELGVLTELVARGVPPKQASKMLLDLMARGANGAQLTALGSAVQGDVAAGLKPDVALDLRGRGVLSLLPPPPSVLNASPRSGGGRP
jgi:hypothetical protein